jgi:hypothetical protein
VGDEDSNFLTPCRHRNIFCFLHNVEAGGSVHGVSYSMCTVALSQELSVLGANLTPWCCLVTNITMHDDVSLRAICIYSLVFNLV